MNSGKEGQKAICNNQVTYLKLRLIEFVTIYTYENWLKIDSFTFIILDNVFL